MGKNKKLNPNKEYRDLIRRVISTVLVTNIDIIFKDKSMDNLEQYINQYKESFYKYFEDKEDIMNNEYTYIGFFGLYIRRFISI